ncbi:MAG: PAS domain S-box protein [Bacteroidota bacterium]
MKKNILLQQLKSQSWEIHLQSLLTFLKLKDGILGLYHSAEFQPLIHKNFDEPNEELLQKIDFSTTQSLQYFQSKNLNKQYLALPISIQNAASLLVFITEIDDSKKIEKHQKDLVLNYAKQLQNTIYQLTIEPQSEEKATHKTRKHYENLLKNTGDLVFVIDKNLQIKEFYGDENGLVYPFKDFKNKHINKTLVDDNLKKSILEAIQKLADKDFYEIEKIEYSIEINGITCWCASHIKKIYNTTKAEIEYLFVVRDITERVRTQEELKLTNELLNETGNLAKVGGWSLDLSNRSVFCSKVTKDILALGIGFDYQLNSFLKFFQHKKSQERIYRIIRETLLERKAKQDRFKIKNYHGNEIWVLIKVNAKFVDDTCVNLYGSIQDITEVKSIEDKLIYEQNRLQHVIEGSDLGAWEWDVQEDIGYHNKKWAEILGYDEDVLGPLDGNKWDKLLHPDDVSKFYNAIQNHLDGKTPFYECELRLKHKNGNYIWILDRGKVVLNDEDGKPTRVYGTHQNITRIKKLENQLKDNYKRFKGIFNLSPVGILLTDFETGEFEEVNNSLLKTTGYSKREFLNLSFWSLAKDSKSEKDKLLLEELSQTGSFGPFERTLITKKGKLFTALIQGKVYLTSDEEKKVLAVVQDITDQKNIQKKLKESVLAAKKASRAKSEFLANMSHEIRTPLNGVIGFADLLKKTPLNHTQQMYMNTVSESAESLMDLISQILDFSKIESGKFELSPSKVNLVSLCKQVSDITKYLAHKKGLELFINLDKNLPDYIETDEVKLRQVLINLLNNALKFTDKGYVELKLSLLDQQAKKANLRFEVIDTGIGIKEQNLNKIFKAFVQEDNSVSKKHGGTGLGLTISNKILKFMNSRLQLTSTYGSGSTFYFEVEFPTYSNPMPAVQAKEFEQIFIIDKDQHSARIIQNGLQQQYANVSCINPNEVSIINRIKNQQKTLIVINQYESKLEVESLLKTLQPQKEATGFKILVLINSNDSFETQNYYKYLGADYLLTKPFLVIDFNEIIEAQQRQALEIGKETASEVVKDTLDGEKIHLLLAEDNPVNMKLVNTYLKNILPKSTIYYAEDGKVALKLFKEEQINFVITDLQMPNMNGFILAKKIRHLDKGKNIPILALTAGTVKGTLEACYRAGIDDCITKPILQDQLAETIKKWQLHYTEEHSNRITFLNSKDILNLDYLKEITGGDEEFLEELLHLANESIADSLQRFELEQHQNDFESMKKTAHKLKGTALNIGAEKIADKAQEIQHFSSTDFKERKQDLSQFTADLENLQKEIKSHLN